MSRLTRRRRIMNRTTMGEWPAITSPSQRYSLSAFCAVRVLAWPYGLLPVAGKRGLESQFAFFGYIENQIKTMTSELNITVSDSQTEQLIRKLLKGGHFLYSVDTVQDKTWEDLTLEDYRAMIRAQRPTIKSKSFRDGGPAGL